MRPSRVDNSRWFSQAYIENVNVGYGTGFITAGFMGFIFLLIFR